MQVALLDVPRRDEEEAERSHDDLERVEAPIEEFLGLVVREALGRTREHFADLRIVGEHAEA